MKNDTRPIVTIVSFLNSDGVGYNSLVELLEDWDEVELPEDSVTQYFYTASKEFLDYFSENKEAFKEAYERIGKADERAQIL